MPADRRAADIETWLRDTIAAAEPGERLPTVRAMMRRFQTAQRRIEAALAPHIAAGRIVVRRGAGISVAPEPPPGPRAPDGDLLVLHRLSDSRLARNLLQEIEVHLRARGIGMLQIGYATEARAIAVLERLPRFRVCLLQLHFEALPLDLLAALHARCDHLVIDGVSVTGIAADSIGTNWREAVSLAFHGLHRRGHRRIGFLTSSHPARQIAMARREYLNLCALLTPDAAPRLMLVDKLPGEYRIEDIRGAIAATLGAGGRPPFTAMLAWGVVEGILLERALADLGLRPGRDVSVVMLGSTDFPSEHRNLFDTVGNSNADKLALFESVIVARLSGEPLPVQTHYLPIGHVPQATVVDIGG